jgi:polyisoprenoid-binding protein YceI
MTSTTAVQIPGYVVGTWDIDASHSTVGFSVRHMMVSKVRGYFREFSGEIVTADDPTQASVTATIDLSSIDTRQEQRDAHIRSADFFDVENHPQMTFRSTAVRTDGADWTVEGELTIKGRTKPVTLQLELNGFGPDAYGGTRAGFSAKTEISRSEFGVDIQMPMDGGGVVVGDKVSVELEIEALPRSRPVQPIGRPKAADRLGATAASYRCGTCATSSQSRVRL